MHTKEGIETIVNAITEEFNQALNQLPLSEETLAVTTRLIELYGKVTGILKTVIQERNIE